MRTNNNNLLKRSVSEMISEYYEINFIKLLNISYTDINSLNNNRNLRKTIKQSLKRILKGATEKNNLS